MRVGKFPASFESAHRGRLRAARPLALANSSFEQAYEAHSEARPTTGPDFLDGILCQLFNVGSRGGKADERGLNFMLSLVKGAKPRDEVEALLAAQMAAVHAATMTFALIPQQDSAERAINVK